MKQVPIEKAGYPELVRFAQERGFDIKYGQVKQEELVRTIREAYPEITTIVVDDDDQQPVTAVTSPAARSNSPSHYSNDPKVVINITSDDANGGEHAYPIFADPVLILVKRDTDVSIPYRHYLVLDNAREEVFRKHFDPVRQRYYETTSIQHTVRFSVKQMPMPDEIAAFHANTRDLGRGDEVKKAA